MRIVNEPMTATMVAIAASCPAGGAMVEVGVYQGGTAVHLLDVARAQGRKLYLFDTFSGMPVSGKFDVHRVGDFADTSVELVRSLCPDAVIVPGIFPDSFIETGPVAFVHADADQYETTFEICRTFAPRMIPGGAILFDDYDPLPGCRMAVDEFFGDHVRILKDGRALVRFEANSFRRLDQQAIDRATL